MTAPNPDTQAETPVGLEDLLIDITGHLHELARLMPLIRDMPDTHRTGGLGFIPPATRQEMGRQWLQERRELKEAAAAGLPVGRGAGKAPGNLNAWSLEADVETTIRHLARFVLRRQPTIAVPADAGDRTEDVIYRLSGMCRQLTDRHVATAVLRDLDHLLQRCRTAVHGETRHQLGAACPHCGRNTLVVYVETGVIECEPPHDQRCQCNPENAVSQRAGGSRLCPCHTSPKYRHHWLRDRSAQHWQSWPALYDAIRQHPKETP